MAEVAIVDQQVEADAEQSTDQAVDTDSGVTDETEASAGDSTTEDTEPEESNENSIELIGKDQYDKLKNDPAKLHKELNRAATKKFQQLAKERSELEPYAEFIQELDRDPRAAIEAVARQLGMEIGGGPKSKTEETVRSLNDQIVESVRKSLGPEYEDLADRLAPAMRQVAEMVSQATAQPLREEQQRIIMDSAQRESVQVLEAFGKKFPDWKTHEKALVAMSNKIQPGKMSEAEYLETLYYLVTRDAKEGDLARSVTERVARSTGNSSSRKSSVSDNVVTERSARPPSFKEAYQAAKAGKRLA